MKENNADNQLTHTQVLLTTGTMVSHYRIIEKIGAGGMGQVYLAEDTKLKRKVALKFPFPEIYGQTESKEKLLAEARTAAALNHPNIVTIYEVGIHDERPYLAMAYIEGKTLKELRARQRIPCDMTIKLGIQICSGLIEAHERGITHRDLKPGNIILDKSNIPHILDFGLALTRRDFGNNDPGKTVTNIGPADIAVGTLQYMAPEQIAGDNIGPLTDIFALGVILYELAYDDHPFKGKSSSELIRNILQKNPDRLTDENSEVPYDLNRILIRCLRKDPNRRFQTVMDIRNELIDLRDLVKEGNNYSFSYPAMPGEQSFLKEERYVLTADSVRQLEFQSPKMIGDHMAYLDNGVLSDTLVIYLHAWGLDHRHCTDFLKALPYRGIAPTLYGFGQNANNRFPLSLNDHSILLRQLFGEINKFINPKYVILTGHSSGADHAAHIGTSETHPGLEITGLLLFGCNTNLGSCFLSEKFAELKHDSAEELLGEMKKMGNNARSLDEWLKFHEYMVTVFSKFGTDAGPLKALGSDLVKPFKENGWKQFAYWYRAAARKYSHFRFVIDLDDFEILDEILGYHLKDNVLGDEFREDTIVREGIPHVQLAHPEILLKHTTDFINQIKG